MGLEEHAEFKLSTMMDGCKIINIDEDMKEVAKLQREVLITLGFDFNFPKVMDFLDMFLTIILDPINDQHNERLR